MMPLSKTNEEYHSLKKEVENARQDIQVIKDCLVGNDFTKAKGLVTEHQELRARVDMLEDTFNKYKNMIIGLAVGSGVGAAAVIKAIVDIFTKH